MTITKKVCGVDECEKPMANIKTGYCNGHYIHFLRSGDAMNIKRRYDQHRRSERLYDVYMSMKQRCNDKNNKSYKHYGGRGIEVCDTWLGIDGYTNFKNDMGECPKGYSIDRIDVNGNYSPDNCRWASPSVQAINRRMRSTNKTGVTGVHFVKSKNIWIAEVRSNGKRITKNCKDMATAIRVREDMFNKYYKPLLEEL